MRVLGVGPGLTRCGLGVVDGAPGRPLAVAAVRVRRGAKDAGHRLLLIERGIERWLEEYRPAAVAGERVFGRCHVRTVTGTAQASAVAMPCAARRGLPVAWHTPSEVKAAVTGGGGAGKAQVGARVARLLRLDAPPEPADALALALCPLRRAPALDRLRRTHAAARPAPALARLRKGTIR
ncbi:crossover junction endodeoxyribonuclease RuvC [Streptomyces sp. GD-15H]|uniref:crossover junction endodeoxyribonuclease RuvC n=1 Tax=Streptomyces sp. GD-15H TaxID=3129112 RepID=UPI00325394CC